MSVVTEILEKSKEYGREFVLLLIVMTAMGIGGKMVFESLNVRIVQQNQRITENEAFIRGELLVSKQQTVEALMNSNRIIAECTAALRDNTQAFKDFRNQ